jgi:uncharacterized repeat protein (TIGR03803 family)
MRPISTVLFAGTIAASLLVHVGAAEAATEQVLYAFCGQQNCPDGYAPNAGVIDVDNTLYGTTYYGGSGRGCSDDDDGCGTVFSLDPSTGAEAVLHSFGGVTDGTNPSTGLFDIGGRLYGTTGIGGYYSAGTAFSVDRRTGREAVLLSFGCCSDGLYPSGGLVGHKGVLYGTVQEGGAYGRGTVFSLDPKTGGLTVLYAFCSQQNCADGAYPLQLIDVKGTLYGMTQSGGAFNSGTVFSVDPDTGTETVLYSFCSQQNCTDGDFPVSGLIDVKGTLYGTTGGGGQYNGGTVFSLNLNTNTETVLHAFNFNGTDGWYPLGGVIDVKGTLYGTTYFGGSGNCYSGDRIGCGTVFAVALKSGAESILYSFQNTGDGANPASNLINVEGLLYGTCYAGGQYGGGTVFSITP